MSQAEQLTLPFLEIALSEKLRAHLNFSLLGASAEDLRDLTAPIAGGILLEHLRQTPCLVSCALSKDKDKWYVFLQGDAFPGKYLGEACAKALLRLWEEPIPVEWTLKPLGVS